MFCNQCQEAKNNVGCDVVGVCGKKEDTAVIQDLLIWILSGISFYAQEARTRGIVDEETDLFIAKSLFATITNVNFDTEVLAEMCREALNRRDALAKALEDQGVSFEELPSAASWKPENTQTGLLLIKGTLIGLHEQKGVHEDIRSLRELLLFGLKGLAAYTEHAYVLEEKDLELFDFLQKGMLAVYGYTEANALIDMVMKCGEMGVKSMALLDKANTGRYGDPEPTEVNIGVQDGPGILISGHDLRDLEELLEQTKGTGIKVYTHGEMLPANAYPFFKKYDHFAGNYGNAWFKQRSEFDSFNGPILMTTNCIVPPKKSYMDRIFTTGMVGWPGVPHIEDRKHGKPKDFSPLIEMAKKSAPPKQIEEGKITIGFAHATLSKVSDTVVNALKTGAIKRFVVMAGCDGRHKERKYYTELAQKLPQDHVILTAGCAKYRYNKLDLGDIGGIPRVLDAGQCNDSYSLVVTALKLKEAFGLDDINELPISYDIAWYEQKAVIVLLSLLYLGVKHIRLGPTLPAFITPGVLKVLVENFDIKPIGSVEEDLKAIVEGQ